MRKAVFIGFMLSASLAQAVDVSGKYLKPDGDIVVRQQGQQLEFAIKSVAGSSSMPSSCGFEGRAVMIDATRASYVSQDKTEACTASFHFEGDRVAVTTSRCEAYCGVRAGGSMEGAYKKKQPR